MTDNIRPAHYRTGEVDLFESWYQTLPWEQYRAVMVSHAEKYMKRIKSDPVEDLEKARYVLWRLREKEIEYAEKNTKTPEEESVYMGEAFVGNKKIETAGQYLDEIYSHHDNLLKRLLNADYEWLARDQDGGLWASRVKPKKYDNVWDDVNDDHSTIIKDDNLPEVKWTDNEPTKISNLLATRENGGENGKQEEQQ